MMINMSKAAGLLLAGLVCCFFSCSNQKDEGPTKEASYATDAKNGLIKKSSFGEVKVTCQYIPDGPLINQGEDVKPIKFYLSVNTGTEELKDSVMYDFNYRSNLLFGLVSGSDTLMPVLSERMMNGRTDLHTFTVLFEPDLASAFASKSKLSFLFYPNRVISDTNTFIFETKDIIKASKILYDHDEVKH